MKIYYPSEKRGLSATGWLVSRHSFSFNDFYDPERMWFGALRVLNHDLILQGAGFPRHSHKDMEIVTIPTFGAVAHQDSTGGEGVVSVGEVQIMSAGTGVEHSEYNASEEERLELLQIWIVPEKYDLRPRYDQRKFDFSKALNQWQVLVTPEGEGALKIYQNVVFKHAFLSTGSRLDLEIEEKKGLYLYVIDGLVEIGESHLKKGDALAVTDELKLEIVSREHSHILAIETIM